MAMDLSVGYYLLERKPTGGPDRQLKIGLSFLF